MSGGPNYPQCVSVDLGTGEMHAERWSFGPDGAVVVFHPEPKTLQHAGRARLIEDCLRVVGANFKAGDTAPGAAFPMKNGKKAVITWLRTKTCLAPT